MCIRDSFKLILKSLKPIFPIIVFTAVLNLFFVSGEGDPVFELGFVTVYAEGIRYAVLMAVLVMALVAGTSLLSYTTSPIVLTDAIEQLLKPCLLYTSPCHPERHGARPGGAGHLGGRPQSLQGRVRCRPQAGPANRAGTER